MLMPESITAAPTRQREKFPRVAAALFWLIPVAFFFWLYHDTLNVWFFADDFAWLSLLRRTHDPLALGKLVFAPMAQGTIRPWSETGFFVVFGNLFGLESFPLRVCVLVTMGANVLLLSWITLRISRSRVAGFLAPVFWVANAALVESVSWNSAYNEVLDAFFLLAATALFILWDQTGRRRFWWCQLVVFVLGFGALEVNIVYPALVAAYALFAARPEHRKRLLASTAPMAVLSIVYFVVHRLLAPLPSTGTYAIHIDSRMVWALATYGRWALVPKSWIAAGNHAVKVAAALWGTAAALVYFLVREIAQRRYTALFFVFWFLIALAPMLPLPDHRDDYYLTIPLLGLAMLAAQGAAAAWRSRLAFAGLEFGPWFARAAVLALAVIWAAPMLSAIEDGNFWWIQHSQQAQTLVLGVLAAQQKHPDKTVVLDGITTPLYNDVVGQAAFYPFGIDGVYLTPGSDTRIRPDDNPGRLEDLVLEPSILAHGITHEEVVVYSLSGDHLKNITGGWARNPLILKASLDQEARRIEVGSALWAHLLGPEWYPLEPGYRWMPGTATVWLGGPRSSRDRLLLHGYCPAEQLKSGPLHLTVSVDGIPLEKTQIDDPETEFRRLFDMPASLIGKQAVEVAISVDKVIHEPGGRKLGLDFGTIAIGRY